MTWRPDLDSSHREAQKIWPLVVPYTRGKGLDVGAGPHKLFPHWTTLDSGLDFGRPIADFTCDAGNLSLFSSSGLDFVFASHIVEHFKDWRAAVAEWWRVVKPAGHLVLYWPHPEHYPRCGMPGANPDHKADIMPADMIMAMSGLAGAHGGWDLIEDETRTGGDEYSQFQVYRKRADVDCQTIPWRKPDKACLIVRYGAFGDAIIASSILPEIKREGWHITFNATPRCQGVLINDPHIDAWLIQDTDQVPNAELGAFWSALRERYDRVINLSESLERTLIAHPSNIAYHYPDAVRRKLFGQVNYLERAHDVADVPHRFHARFYPSDEERAWAAAERLRLAGASAPVVVMALSGSSVHKLWPHVDVLVVWLMQATDARVVLAGGEGEREIAAVILASVERHYAKTERVVSACGPWSIRQTMAFAQLADVVTGPETGLLNAVALERDVAKVVYLSHSSPANLTKHWVNTQVMTPPEDKVPCWPCHRLHYSRKHCVTDEPTGQAACAVAIEPKWVMEAIKGALRRRPARPANAVAAE